VLARNVVALVRDGEHVPENLPAPCATSLARCGSWPRRTTPRPTSSPAAGSPSAPPRRPRRSAPSVPMWCSWAARSAPSP
jgi:hypothetical protein